METKQELKLKDFERNGEGKYVIPLTSPIDFGEETIKELLFTEPKMKHIRKMSAEPTLNDILNICGNLCCQTPAVMDELSLKDGTKVAEFFGLFS